jgi:hypothetical protein
VSAFGVFGNPTIPAFGLRFLLEKDMLRTSNSRSGLSTLARSESRSARPRSWRRIGLENLESRLMMNGAVLATVF